MPVSRILTIGAFETTETNYFNALIEARVDLFVDVRQRRGVRGAEYAYVNHKRLVHRLDEIGIPYLHELVLAPTTEDRQVQYRADDSAHIARRKRDHLSPEFIEAYHRDVLDHVDLAEIVTRWGTVGSAVVLFCAEREPAACHRSIIAEAVGRLLGIEPEHLMPEPDHNLARPAH